MQGSLSWFEDILPRYLPHEGRILEAGCGTGQYVVALRARGYNVEGVDWSTETVESVKVVFPDLPVRGGEVTSLDVPDEYYDAYISFGVVEHRREGPELFLREAHRVVRAGGVAFVSVPYFHPLRRLKAGFGLYRGKVAGLDFYQYAFTEDEFGKLLEQAKFHVIDRMLYDSLKGLREEIPLLKRVFELPVMGWRVRNWIRSRQWISKRFGHMILFVCRRK